MNSLLRLVSVLALVALTRAYEDKTVYQYLQDNGFTEFVKLLNETGLQSLLSGTGPFTIFAPTNAAIQNREPALVTLMSQSALHKRTVVKYHVASNFVFVPNVPAQGKVIDTLAGQKLTITKVNQTLKLNNNTYVSMPPNNDIICNNGVIQPIDHVLTPPMSSSENIAAVLVERDDLFQEFFMSIMLANMTKYFESAEYTLFAPVDSAFGEISRNLLGSHIPMDKRLQIYEEMVKYHMVPGARASDDLKNGQHLYTLHGTPLNISINAQSAIMVNYAHVLNKDIAASNGVIHAIDHLLFPRDMLAELTQLYNQYDKTTTMRPASG